MKLNDGMRGERELFIVPSGGLANRMRAIASGMQLAKDRGFRPIIIWRANRDAMAGYSDLFHASATSDIVIEPGALQFNMVYEIPRKKNLYTSLIAQKLLFEKCLFDETALASIAGKPERLVSLIGDSKKVLIKSGLEFYPPDTDYYRETFQPSASVKNAMEEIVSAFAGAETYGFHIRRTDNKESIQHSPIQLFLDKADSLLSGGGTKIFLATDSEKVKDVFRKRYDKLIITTPHQACRFTKDGMTRGFAEMHALARTKKIFGSYYSSYSEAAALLGNTPIEQLKI